MSGEDLLPHQLEERLKKNSEDILAATLKHIGDPDGVQKLNRLGHPGDVICEVATEIGADLVVIGDRGQGGPSNGPGCDRHHHEVSADLGGHLADNVAGVPQSV